MTQITEIFRANTGLMLSCILLAGATFVCTLLGIFMKASGASLRPIVFFAIYFALMFIPQLVGHCVNAVRPKSAESPQQPTNQNSQNEDSSLSAILPSLPIREGRFTNHAQVFGPGIMSELIQDVRQSFASVLSHPEAAELAMTQNGELILAAQFSTEKDAWKSAASYQRTYQILHADGNLETGWRGQSALNGFHFEMISVGRILYVWSAAKPEAVRERRHTTPLGKQVISDTLAAEIAKRREQYNNQTKSSSDSKMADPKPDPLFPSLQFLKPWFQPWYIKFAGILALLFLCVTWFFKGSSWAATSPAQPEATPLTALQLAARIESINGLDVPFRIDRGDAPNSFVASWKYADAKWMDMARAHGLRKSFQIRFVLDETTKKVRATDYAARQVWSAGKPGIQMQWMRIKGIFFFQYEQGRVFGLQWNDQGGFKPILSYSYKFNLNEMKSPLIQAVTSSGWDWRPTPWQGPTWLNWLLE